MAMNTLSTYMHPDATITPAPPPETKPEARATPRPVERGNHECDGCHLRADELHSINDGPRLCRGCVVRAEEEARRKAYEPIRRQHEAEMEKFREQQRLADLRPPNPEHECEIHSAHGRAEVLRGGLLLCRECAAKTDYDPSFTYPEAPILLLEKRVAALEAQLAAPAAKATRKAAS
jgi:hypothetical protein